MSLHRSENGRARFIAVSAAVLVALLVFIFFYSRPGLLPKESREVVAVRIWNDWSGLGPDRIVHYSMARQGETYRGEVYYSEVGEATTVWSTTEAFSIPAGAVDAFLFVLSYCPLEKGEYDPGIKMTDNYPARRIELETARGVVVLHSESQEEGGAPWAAEVRGKKYVIRADVPMRALNVLAPHLVSAASP